MIDYPAQFSVQGKNAVVTGGAGAIGSQIVTALAQAKARVAIVDIDKKKTRALARELSQQKLDVLECYVDVTRIGALERNCKAIARRLGSLDIWVNAAYPRTADWNAKVEKITAASWQKNIDMHLNAYALTTKYAAELMKSKGGSIINLSSIYGVVGADFALYQGTDMTMPAAYAAIKGGIINLGRYFSSYFGAYNIRVNTVCPGGLFAHQNKSFVRRYIQKTPLKRMARASEIASVVLFLSSEASSYITGATIMVDGGWTAI